MTDTWLERKRAAYKTVKLFYNKSTTLLLCGRVEAPNPGNTTPTSHPNAVSISFRICTCPTFCSSITKWGNQKHNAAPCSPGYGTRRKMQCLEQPVEDGISNIVDDQPPICIPLKRPIRANIIVTPHQKFYQCHPHPPHASLPASRKDPLPLKSEAPPSYLSTKQDSRGDFYTHRRTRTDPSSKRRQSRIK
jgi:hypothetical protein